MPGQYHPTPPYLKYARYVTKYLFIFFLFLFFIIIIIKKFYVEESDEQNASNNYKCKNYVANGGRGGGGWEVVEATPFQISPTFHQKTFVDFDHILFLQWIFWIRQCILTRAHTRTHAHTHTYSNNNNNNNDDDDDDDVDDDDMQNVQNVKEH